jgi:hypothetical protein
MSKLINDIERINFKDLSLQKKIDKDVKVWTEIDTSYQASNIYTVVIEADQYYFHRFKTEKEAVVFFNSLNKDNYKNYLK